MSFTKSMLLGSAAVVATVIGAQAADLPSKKAAPATYVKICDAYGAGFFYIPGSETCVKLGGYVRAEYQYVPGKDVYTPVDVIDSKTKKVTNAPGTILQSGKNLAETGFETRGRIDVDARTPTSMGVARTFVRLRAANTSGIRNTKTDADKGALGQSDNSTTGITIESAMVQWAGFTFGVASENYAMMPSMIYNANPWAGFPNGMKQISYTARLGDGLSATLALEDRKDFGYDQTAFQRVSTGANIVGNVRMDQAWGFAAVHGLVGNNSLDKAAIDGVKNMGDKTYSSYAIGSTVNFKLPMIAAGDQIWFTANYARGALGALLSGGGLSVMSSSSAKRINSGVIRIDSALVQTTGAGSTSSNAVFETTSGWNFSMAATHYWAKDWRSNFSAGYVEMNPPTINMASQPTVDGTVVSQWGKGKLWEVAGSIIYSPVANLDIGLELQYANLKNKMQNPTAAFLAAGQPGLSVNNITTKMRVERTF